MIKMMVSERQIGGHDCMVKINCFSNLQSEVGFFERKS